MFLALDDKQEPWRIGQRKMDDFQRYPPGIESQRVIMETS